MTAQILVGRAHPNHGGINPSHYIFLSEALTLVAQNIFPEEVEDQRRITWIPTRENILEDALLMIGLYVLEDEKLLKLANEYFTDFSADRIELHKDIDGEKLEELYQECRKLDYQYKIVINDFDDGRLHPKVLEEYSMDVTVCTPDYKRWYSRWQDEVRTEGTLSNSYK